MEVPEQTCPASHARNQPAPAPGLPGTPGRQASPHMTLGPVILPPEQGLAPTMFLKALPIPLYHTVPPGGLQPRAPLVTGSLDGGSVPFILSPLLQPEGPGCAQLGKPATPTLTVNIVGTLPVLSPGLGPVTGGPGKARNSGKYLCPHCGRDCLKPSVLEKHIRSHTGERPFPCATCGIAFKTQSNLYKHRRTQTHLNNSRLSSESEGTGGSLLEEGDKAGETSRVAGKGDSWSPGGGDGAPSERSLSPGLPTHLSPTAKNLDLKLEAVSCPASTLADKEVPVYSTYTASAGLPLAGSQPRRKLPEQKSPTASRVCSLQQQVTSSEKPWDTKASESRLRKCESTDSGYLSRSDSAEQPLAPGSPLHSLSEHSAESEGEGVLGPGGPRAEPGGRGPSLELEKRQLEERIAWLISHNQAVVDDPQLDHVRPRKTVLSKQGSIDLPMPYTYKDSFHFEIRAPEPVRRRHGALCPARSTCVGLDKARPLFFHSVPTQLSTTVECVPITRSNSLPFVEGPRMWQEPRDPQDTCPGRQKPLSPRSAPAQLVDVPSSHPRALVRQAAVEDLPGPPTGDTVASTEDPAGKGAVAGEEATIKGKAAGRKPSQRKAKMFSQEKWQVYGNETFQRIYQKMHASHQGSRKAREWRVGHGTELDHPLQEQAVGGEGAAQAQIRRTPVCGDTSVGAKPGPWGSPPAMEGVLVIECPKQREAVARAGGSDQPRASRVTSPPTLSCGAPPCLGSKSPVLPPNGRLELGCQLPSAPGPLKGGDLEVPKLVLPHPKLEGGTQGGGDTKEPCQQDQIIPRRPSGSFGEPQSVEDKLPSERKKLRVEELSCPEHSGPLGARGQNPGGPAQATSLPSQNQDSDSGDRPGGLYRSADCMETSGAPFSTCSVALRPAGPRAKEPVLGPAAEAPGSQAQPAAQPRAPGVLEALTDTAFPPKYLLRLPKGETLLPRQGQDPLCRSGLPEELDSSAGPGLGTLLPPPPATGLAPGRDDNFGEGPSWSRPWGRRKEVPGEEKRALDTSSSAAKESHRWSAGAPRETASALPTPPCDSWRRETGGTWAGARPCGGVLSPWALNRDTEGPPENAQEDPPPGPLAGHSPCCSLRPSPALSALPPRGWPELTASTHPGSPGCCGPQGPFPSLRAEPRLTWCCLSRSVPLPTEQKEKAASVYWALHGPGGSAPDQGAGAQPVSKAVSGPWTGTSPAEGGEAQPWKLSYPTAPGMTSRDPGPEPGWKRGPPRRRAKMPRGSSKQKKLRRYRGSFSQGRVQLRASRLRKPLWALRKGCHPAPLEGLGPRRSLGHASSETETAGRSVRGESPCTASASAPSCGNGEEQGDRRPASGSGSPSTGPRTVGERDTSTVTDIIPSAGERGDCCPQNTVVGSELSLPPDLGTHVASGLPSCGKGLNQGLPETQPPSQEQVAADPTPCAFSDAQEPSTFESEGNSPCHDIATSVAAVSTSLGAGGGPTTPSTPSAEPQGRGRAAGETPTPSSLDRKAIAQGTSRSLLPGKPSPGCRLSGSVALRSPGKTHLDIPASGPSSTSSHQETGRPKTPFPPREQHVCGERLVPCPPGEDTEKTQESGSIARKDGVVPCKPAQPPAVPEAPSKATKKRSLEGMRKQTRVEFSDTSSDDEDRLVIEL